MKYIFFLSADYIDLAKEEVFSLFDFENFKIFDRLLIINLKNNGKELKELSHRLALTKSIYKFLFECRISELIDVMKNFDWKSVYKDNFCLRINYIENALTKKSNKINKKAIKKLPNVSELIFLRTRSQLTEKDLAGYVWRSLSNPKVNLENPKTKIELFFVNDKIYCGLLIKKLNQNFEQRKPHLRPFTHPSSLHPKLARALVNISGIKENEVLLDPFCGTGGFLIEAGLMNIKIIGCDASKNMIKGCKENLKHFKIRKYKLINKNAIRINNKFDYAITDLPYGLNSNVYLQYNKKSIIKNSNKINLKINKRYAIENLEQFYLKFLKMLRNSMGISGTEKSVKQISHDLRKNLNKKAVIVFPSYVNYKKLLKMSKFKIEREFSVYVHRSLTRKIVRIS